MKFLLVVAPRPQFLSCTELRMPSFGLIIIAKEFRCQQETCKNILLVCILPENRKLHFVLTLPMLSQRDPALRRSLF